MPEIAQAIGKSNVFLTYAAENERLMRLIAEARYVLCY